MIIDNFPNKQSIIDSIIAGIIQARENYTFWTSNKIQLLDADDDFLIIHIAQEIAKLEYPPEIFMHANISDILKCSLQEKQDYKYFMKEHLLAQDTISLTLDKRSANEIDKQWVSKAVITVRNGVLNKKDEYKNDIQQLCKILQREKKEDSSLDFAIFTFYLEISQNARIDASKRLTNIKDSFDEVVKNYTNLKSNFKGGDIKQSENTGQWCVGCYIIEPNI